MSGDNKSESENGGIALIERNSRSQSALNEILEHMAKQSKPLVLLTGLIMVILLILLDYAIGFQLSFTLFYIIPVFFVVWFVGICTAIVVCDASAPAWRLLPNLEFETFSSPLVYLGYFVVYSTKYL